MTYLRNKFHMPSPHYSLVIAIKPKAKENMCTAAMLLFYMLYTVLKNEQKFPTFRRFITTHQLIIRD
jgi:hypothetical protein